MYGICLPILEVGNDLICLQSVNEERSGILQDEINDIAIIEIIPARIAQNHDGIFNASHGNKLKILARHT